MCLRYSVLGIWSPCFAIMVFLISQCIIIILQRGLVFFAVIFVDCRLIHEGQEACFLFPSDNTGSFTPSSGLLEGKQKTNIFNREGNCFFFKKINNSLPITEVM